MYSSPLAIPSSLKRISEVGTLRYKVHRTHLFAEWCPKEPAGSASNGASPIPNARCLVMASLGGPASRKYQSEACALSAAQYAGGSWRIRPSMTASRWDIMAGRRAQWEDVSRPRTARTGSDTSTKHLPRTGGMPRRAALQAVGEPSAISTRLALRRRRTGPGKPA